MICVIAIEEKLLYIAFPYNRATAYLYIYHGVFRFKKGGCSKLKFVEIRPLSIIRITHFSKPKTSKQATRNCKLDAGN